MCIIMLIFLKITLNKLNDNYYRGVIHKPPLKGLSCECDGGAVIVRHGQVSK